MTVKWGIIGCGDVTEVKSGPGLQKAEGSALVAVMRRNTGLAEDYARRHNVPRWYDDADDLIADPDVNAVYVATPVSSHMEYALKAAAAGKPAYVEKPMARNAKECHRMVAAFKESGQKLFVAYYRRRLPRFLKAKEIIESGKLGILSGVEYAYTEPVRTGFDPDNPPWRYTAEHGGGGLFLDLGSHTLDIIDYLVGPLTQVHGDAMNIASPYEVEDSVTMKVRAGNVPGTAQWNFAGFSKRDLIRFNGTVGRLELSCFGTEPLRLETKTGVEEFALSNPEHIQQPLIQSVVNDILGREEAPSTGETAARTSEVIDKVLSGYYGGRSDTFWRRPETWPGRRVGFRG